MSEFTTLPARRLGEPVVGYPSHWARDLALLGAALPASAGLFLTLTHLTPIELALVRLPYLLTLSGTGAVLGALGGAGVAFALERVRGQVPLGLLVTAGVLGTATWGLATVFVASLGTALPLAMLLFTLWWGMVLGTAAVPYLVARVLRGPTTAIAVAAVVAAGPLAVGIEKVLFWFTAWFSAL